MRVFLDNCCFNRPFDNQAQTRVRLEAEAKLSLQEQVRSGRLEFAWSYVLDFENSANPFEERRTTISDWRRHTSVNVEESAAVLDRADALAGLGLKSLRGRRGMRLFRDHRRRNPETRKGHPGSRRRRSRRLGPGVGAMIADTEVRVRGLRALVDALGTVEAERFIALILREPFDYTRWRRHLWADKSVQEISEAAMALRRNPPDEDK